MSMQSEEPREQVSVGALLGSLARDTGLLVRQEVQLASVEMTLKAKAAARNAALVAIGGGLALAGLLAFMLAAIFGLQLVMPMWLASLIVGFVIVGAGYALVQKGLSALAHIDPLPKRTIKTLKGDMVWAKEELQ